MVEIDASTSSIMTTIVCLPFTGVFFLVFSTMTVYMAYLVFKATGLISQSTTDDPVDVRTTRTGMVLGFSLSFCGCSILRAGQAYLNRNTDAIYDIGAMS